MSDTDPKCVTDLPHAETALRAAVFFSLGYASMCWSETPTGIFESEKAVALGEDLIATIIEVTHLGLPSLGCATTAEIVAEYDARLAYAESARPDYRTVGEA